MQQVVAVVGRGVVEWGSEITTAADLGTTRGDGCFEATLVERRADGVLVHNIDPHLARLARSAGGLQIAGAPTPEDWLTTIEAAVAAWSGERAVLKIVLTRGNEFAPAGATAFLTLTELTAGVQMAADGVRLSCLNRGYPAGVFDDAPWLLGGIKTISYAVNMAAKREAASRGADDVLFITSDGYALEGPTAGLIWRIGDRLGTTPTGATGILESITVGKVLAGAEASGWAVDRELIALADLKQADAAWLMSSVRGVSPILALDDVTLTTDAELTESFRRWAGFIE